jgi:peptidoglycan/xylan/chitin deacetylase (PgdA/CDA1 family)
MLACPSMSRGVLCISIDLELGWGIWDRPSEDYFARCAAHEDEIVARLLALFTQYDVSATWAIVARLLERPATTPAASSHGDRIWYAPHLIEAIRGARPVQDIGSHSYAHVYFGESPRDELERDLAAARRIHGEHGLGFTSFVFPRNQVAHLDLLAAAGVRVFRSVDRGWHMSIRQRLGRIAGRIANLADKVAPVPPAVVSPIRHRNGLVELPSSMLLMSRSGARRLVRPEVAAWKGRLGVAAAARTGRIFHLWFHPSNFYHDTETQLGVLAEILAAAARLRDRDKLDIRPMSDYAEAA